VAAVASVALRYPTPDIARRRDELAALVAANAGSSSGGALGRFVAWWTSLSPGALEQVYVETFDLHRRCSLYLTYYVHGDRRQRGQEFVRLKRLYESAGQRLTGRELPDYLPLMLEFAALEPAAGTGVLVEQRVGLELLRAALHESGSPYANVLEAICAALPALDHQGQELLLRLAAEGPPGEQVGLEPYGPPEAMPPSAWQGAPR
jgi:nitrate reductase delta subunit